MITPPLHKSLSKQCFLTKHYFYETLLAVFAFVFLIVFNRSSSFLNLSSGYDESIFKLFGLALAEGRVPLRDYIDRKGPYLFFINAIPYITHTYRFGLFLIQFGCMYISSLLIFRVLVTYTARKTYAVLALIGMYAFYAVFYAEGGQCEDYELLFITLALYLCWSFIRQKRPAAEHPYLYTFVYGICFGIIGFIRINDTATICGIVLGFAYLLIREKKIGTLFAHVGIFFAGLFIAILPVLLYFALNHAINDMVYWTFIEGISYNSKSFSDYVKSYSSRLFMFLPLFIMLFLARKNDKVYGTYFLPIMTAITSILYLTIGTNNFEHYFIVLLPYYAATVAYLLSAKKTLALCILLCHFFPQWWSGFSQRPGFLLMAKLATDEIGHYRYLRNFNAQAKEMYLSVPEDERGNIFAYNISHGMGFYTINKVLPPNRSYVFYDSPYWHEDWENNNYQYVLYQTREDWKDDGEPLVEGYHEVSRIDSLKHPNHEFMLHLLEKD